MVHDTEMAQKRTISTKNYFFG